MFSLHGTPLDNTWYEGSVVVHILKQIITLNIWHDDNDNNLDGNVGV